MPHPRRVELLAEAVAAIGAAIDDAVAAHIVNGTRLPSESAVVDRVRRQVEAAVRAAFDDVAAGSYTETDVAVVSASILADLLRVVRRQFADAMSRRGQVELAETIPPRREGSPAVPVAGFGAAVVALTRRLGRRRARGREGRAVLRRAAATSGSPLPRSSGPVFRQIVRTRIAEERNTLAANVADRVSGGVVYVEDARLGPTDEPCEQVDGQYATTRWARRHRVEHPNCTRRFRPARLPQGRRVTLLE